MKEKYIDVIMLAMTVAATIVFLSFMAIGYCEVGNVVTNGIVTLQPAIEGERLEKISQHIDTAANENNIDPLLIVSIIFRESSFREEVEILDVRGTVGEIGLTQIHPLNSKAISMRPDNCTETLEGVNGHTNAYCQIHTGARYLAWIKSVCPGSWWRWVAAYGMSQCPDPTLPIKYRGAKIAHGYYTRIGGKNWE